LYNKVYYSVLVPNSPSQSTIFQTRAVAATGLEGTNDELEGLKPDDSPERAMTGQNLLGKYQVCTKCDDGFHQL
jgi:hypothetical protein